MRPVRFSKKKEESSYAKGVAAERCVAQFFEGLGYAVLERRFKTKFGEIDLIVQKAAIICFVEVKARKTLDEALRSITPRNRKRIEQSALHYISQNESCARLDLQFDVVAITEGGEITHLDNAWLAGDN